MRYLILVFLLGGFCGCGFAQQPGKGLSPVPGTPAAPQFSLPDLDGNQFRLFDFRGKVVIVNFWATWCPPCREEMPSMQRAWTVLEKEGILMLAINVGEDEDTIFEFTASYPVEFPLLLDSDSGTTSTWPLRGLPTTFVIGPKGRLIFRAVGGREWDNPVLLDQVRALRQ